MTNWRKVNMKVPSNIKAMMLTEFLPHRSNNCAEIVQPKAELTSLSWENLSNCPT